MANRFQLQFVNPGSPADFVVEFHRWLPNDLGTEQPGLGWNCEILLDRRPGHGPPELSEDYIQSRRHLSIGNSKSNSLVRGQTFSSDGGLETIGAWPHKSYLRSGREVEILCTREADAKRAVPRPSGRAVTSNLNALSASQVPIER